MSSSSFRRLALLLLLLAAALAAGLLRQRGDPAEPVSRRQMLLGTVVEIVAFGEERRRLEAGIDAAFAEMARLEGLLGPAAGSDLARLAEAPAAFDLAPETAEVIALALRIQEASGGAFDPGLGRLKALWGFDGQPQVPTPAQIETALIGAGPRSLRLEGHRAIKADPRLAVDLGGIAKGYAVDRAVEILRETGVSAVTVNAGGDIRLLGDRDGRPWRIGIQHPRHPEQVVAILPLNDTAVVTSGDYERFFERDGVRYHHLFDPRTGLPARLCQSVTVLAPSAALADALATAAFVLGPQQGLALLEAEAAAEGMIIDAAGTVHLTGGLQGSVEWP